MKSVISHVICHQRPWYVVSSVLARVTYYDNPGATNTMQDLPNTDVKLLATSYFLFMPTSGFLSPDSLLIRTSRVSGPLAKKDVIDGYSLRFEAEDADAQKNIATFEQMCQDLGANLSTFVAIINSIIDDINKTTHMMNRSVQILVDFVHYSFGTHTRLL
jgi:hypothetical protein